jgi:hypothetical protein
VFGPGAFSQGAAGKLDFDRCGGVLREAELCRSQTLLRKRHVNDPSSRAMLANVAKWLNQTSH